MNGKRPKEKRQQPPPSKRRWVAVLLLLVLGVLLVALFFNRNALALWAARRSLAENSPHEALQWVRWGDRQGGESNPANRLVEALIQNRLGFTVGARQSVDRAEELGATVKQIDDHYDLISARLGDIEAAERLSENEAASVPVREFFHSVVHCAMYRGRMGWGHSLLDRWQEQFPGDTGERYLRGRILEIEGEPAEAIRCYDTVLANQEDFHEAAFRLGYIYRDRREFAKAGNYFRRCLDSPYDTIARIELADCLSLLGETKQAVEMLEPTLDAKPEEFLRQYLPIEVYVEDDRPALIAAELYESLDDQETAVKYYQRAAEYNPRNLAAHAQLAILLRLLKQDEEADKHAAIHQTLLTHQAQVADLQARLEETPDDLDLRCDLAELHLLCTSVADAQIELQRVLNADPDHPRAQAILSRLRDGE